MFRDDPHKNRKKDVRILICEIPRLFVGIIDIFSLEAEEQRLEFLSLIEAILVPFYLLAILDLFDLISVTVSEKRSTVLFS